MFSFLGKSFMIFSKPSGPSTSSFCKILNINFVSIICRTEFCSLKSLMSLLCFERLSYCLAPEIHGIQNISTLSDNLVLYFQTFIVLILLLIMEKSILKVKICLLIFLDILMSFVVNGLIVTCSGYSGLAFSRILTHAHVNTLTT